MSWAKRQPPAWTPSGTSSDSASSYRGKLAGSSGCGHRCVTARQGHEPELLDRSLASATRHRSSRGAGPCAFRRSGLPGSTRTASRCKHDRRPRWPLGPRSGRAQRDGAVQHGDIDPLGIHVLEPKLRVDRAFPVGPPTPACLQVPRRPVRSPEESSAPPRGSGWCPARRDQLRADVMEADGRWRSHSSSGSKTCPSTSITRCSSMAFTSIACWPAPGPPWRSSARPGRGSPCRREARREVRGSARRSRCAGSRRCLLRCEAAPH